MLQSNAAIVINGDMSGEILSDVFSVPQQWVVSIQCVWTGAPVGVFYVEYSNDLTASEGGAGVSTWVIAPNGSFSVPGQPGKLLFRTYSLGERWVRLRWEQSGGSGTLNARFNAKGV